MTNLEIIQYFEEELESQTGLEFTVKTDSDLEHWILNDPSEIDMRVHDIAWNLERRSAKEFFEMYRKGLTISAYDWACYKDEPWRVKGTGLAWHEYG